MRSDPDGAHVGFDPIGLRVTPGTVVRWVVEANVHTATAYHPVQRRPPAPHPGAGGALGFGLPGRARAGI